MKKGFVARSELLQFQKSIITVASICNKYFRSEYQLLKVLSKYLTSTHEPNEKRFIDLRIVAAKSVND